LGSRSQTTFSWDSEFKEIYQGFNEIIQARILSSLKRFEQAWRNSNADNEIPSGFDFTPYPVNEPLRLVELHVGYDYRAFVMFPDGRFDAYWIHLFKKPGRKVPPKEIRLAKSRAIDCWNAINQ
jgi:hypothetical protein